MRRQTTGFILTVAACAGAVLLTRPVGHVEAQGSASNYPGAYELLCPVGGQPIQQFSSWNPTTQRWRANQCIDGNGNVTASLAAGTTIGGAAPATLPVNLGGGSGVVTGTLPGANMAVVNLAASGNGGVSGVLATANEGSGTASAGKYVDGGTGAWTVVPASGVSEATWSTSNSGQPGSFVVSALVGATLLPSAHTLIRYTISLSAQEAACTTVPVFAFEDITSTSVLSSLSIANSTSFIDSGTLSVSMTAGHEFGVVDTTAGAGCTGGSSGWTATVVFK